MYKPQSLLDHLQAAVPALRTAPDQLSMLVREGRIVAAGAASLSYEYHFTVQLVALDFSGHPDALIVPIVAWLRVHQPELADNPEQRAKAFRFEAVCWEVRHAIEPARLGIAPIREEWEIWDQHAGELLATWTIEPERV